MPPPLWSFLATTEGNSHTSPGLRDTHLVQCGHVAAGAHEGGLGQLFWEPARPSPQSPPHVRAVPLSYNFRSISRQVGQDACG